jgi:hypothetical protein
MSGSEPVAGIHVPLGMLPAVILGALIRQSGGSVEVSEQAYRREAARVLEGVRSELNVDRGREGYINVRISDAVRE